MWSITLTDLFQGMVMLFVLTLAGILCFANFGSPTELYANAASLRPQWSTNTSAAYLRLAFFGGFMTWVFVHSCLPHTIMRVFTAEDEKSGRLGLSFGSFLISAFALLALVYITGAAVIVNGGADLESYDYVFMTVIDSIFPTWFQAVTYAGVFAAVMSSVSGMLLSIGSAASFDLVQVLKPLILSQACKPLSVVKNLVLRGFALHIVISTGLLYNGPGISGGDFLKVLIMPILLRFVLGGGAIVACTLIARISEPRIGGIFAAFPAVYLAAILSLYLDYRGEELIKMSVHISEGALVGMLANIICAVAASHLIMKNGWEKGLGLALFIWLLAATCIYFTWKLVIT